MSEISNFRFWCQKVLPAVYDDSLSYYELLCKVVAKLNEVINSQNSTNDNTAELAQQFEQLKNDLQGTVESEVEKVVDNYVKTNNLVKSINGITAVGETGAVTLQASDVGAIANVNDSVKENNIQDGAVTADKLAPGAVGTDKIADGAITGDKLSNDAAPVKSVNTKTGEVVLSADDVGAIANTDGAVTTPKMADYSVTNPKIAMGTITPDRMADQGVENAGKLLKIGADGKPAWLSGEGTVTAGVESVNGKDGVVTLTAQDVGAIKANSNALKSTDLSIYVEDGFLAWLSTTYPQASPQAPVSIFYYGFPPLVFDGTYVKPSSNNSFSSIWNSTHLEGLRFTGIINSKFLDAIDNTVLTYTNKTPTYTSFVKSVNGKTGNATLAVDDIEGALKEVAPSDMLTGQSVVGAYLFLAPADGETDAFQKVDKLPENMIPNIDGSKIKYATIKSLQLAGGSVTEDKIGLYAVTANKINAGAVTEDKIANDSVSLSKMKAPGADFSGKVLGVSSTGQWELQTHSGGGEWEEIPATSLIAGATVHCRIQPGTGWLWFSIESDSTITLASGKTTASDYSIKLWGTINFNACNSPVPPNDTSTASDYYLLNKDSLVVNSTTSGNVNGTSVQKIATTTFASSVTPVLAVSRNKTGVTRFGLRNNDSTVVQGKYASFYVPLWFDNRGVEAYEATNEADTPQA